MKREGRMVQRQTGSHVQLKRDGQRITAPDHRGDLKPGIEKEIRKRRGGKPPEQGGIIDE
ncbi:MAG: type II toxin-antitoxin system HicA family toxin [Clostridia bacterium]|nr:type II toxin-antitoxin system HicA family toxin [Clostridia bacterium]